MTLAISERTMFAFFSLLTVVFLALWFETFSSLTLRLTPAMDCFLYVTYGIFALWFSPNQMFVIKFSVSFATVVERTRPSHVFTEVCARQKNLKRATGHLSPPTDNAGGLKSLLLWWKTRIFVHLMPNKCSCYNLHVAVTVFVLFFFQSTLF